MSKTRQEKMSPRDYEAIKQFLNRVKMDSLRGLDRANAMLDIEQSKYTIGQRDHWERQLRYIDYLDQYADNVFLKRPSQRKGSVKKSDNVATENTV